MVAAGVVAGAVAIGGVAGAMIGIPGLSGAATSGSSDSSTSTSTPAGESPADGHHFRGFFGVRMGDDGVFAAAAKALNLSTEDLLEKLRDGKTTIADVAEQQGVDVQTVIDAMEAVAKQNIEDLVNNPLPAPPEFPDGGRIEHRFGFGIGFGAPGMRDSFDQIAKALGITTDELQSDLRDGQSIADIAKAKNVDLDTIADALVNEAQSKLDEAVKDEKLTREQADRIAEHLKQRITDLLNGEPLKALGPWGEHGPGFGPGGPGRFGGGGPWPGSPEEAEPSAAAI
jgi:urease gamma subunit